LQLSPSIWLLTKQSARYHPDINKLLSWLQNGVRCPAAEKPGSRRITSIKAFSDWLQQSGRILADPPKKLSSSPSSVPCRLSLTIEEQEKALEAANAYRTAKKPDARPYTLLNLLLSTGVKKGECLAINTNHVDLEAPGGPVLFVRYASPRNRYKERKINLTEEWVEA
jgi:integrase/recombinase XerD